MSRVRKEMKEETMEQFKCTCGSLENKGGHSVDCPHLLQVMLHDARLEAKEQIKGLNDRIWERFVFLLSVESFGEKEVLMEKKVQKNFHGSIEAHKKVFDLAVKEVLGEAEIAPK